MTEHFIDAARKFCASVENLKTMNYPEFKTDFFQTSVELLFRGMEIGGEYDPNKGSIGESLSNERDLEKIRIEIKRILKEKIAENMDNEYWEFDYAPIDGALTVNIAEVYAGLNRGLLELENGNKNRALGVLLEGVRNEYGWNISNIVCILYKI